MMKEIKPTESRYRTWFVPTDKLPDEVYSKLNGGDESADIKCNVCEQGVHYRIGPGGHNEQISGYIVFYDFVICGRCIDDEFGITEQIDEDIEHGGWLNGYRPVNGFEKQ